MPPPPAEDSGGGKHSTDPKTSQPPNPTPECGTGTRFTTVKRRKSRATSAIPPTRPNTRSSTTSRAPTTSPPAPNLPNSPRRPASPDSLDEASDIAPQSSPSTSPSHSRDSSPDNPPSSTPPMAPSNRILIKNHVCGANNPFHLAKVLRTNNLRIKPPQNYYSFKNQSTLLIFTSPSEAQFFTSHIPAAPTFGTTAKYAPAPRPDPKPTKPSTSRAPMLHVVVRGVCADIGEDELSSAAIPPGSCGCGRGFVRARRIVARDDRVTGLVRLFSTCQDCIAAVLREGLTVLGRTYKVEPPRHQLIRPCGRCHAYGHVQRDCAHPHALCRVCGYRVRDGVHCNHEGHDLSRPYCCSCNKFGHFTGQRHCPKYPKPSNDPDSTAPVQLAPPPPPTSNPWNLKLKDFPSLELPDPPTPQDHEPSLEAQEPPPDEVTPSETTNSTPSVPQQPQTAVPQSTTPYVTLDSLNSFLEKFLTAISEGFQRTFDSLTAIVLSTVPSRDQRKVREAVNNISKKMFDMRTIFQTIGPSLNVLHSSAKRSHGGNI